MKIARTISIVLYAIIFMIIGSLAYEVLFESSGGRGGGFGYGNLWIRYEVEERRTLSPRITWLIATPEMPTKQSYRGDKDQWTFVFTSGKTFTFRPDSKHLVWIDPTTGPTMVPADLTGDLMARIEETREEAQGHTYGNATEFLASLAKTDAEQ